MRFKDFIVESTDEAKIISQLTDTPLLFRNMTAENVFGVAKTRKDRTPLDTPTNIHAMVDDWFFKTFGKRYRSAAVFCFTDLQSTYTYFNHRGKGHIFNISPVDEYTTVCYSSKATDLWIDHLSGLFDIDWDSIKINKENRQKIENKMNSLGYKEIPYLALNNDGKFDGVEMMLYCDDYYYYRTKDLLKKQQ